MSIFSIGRQRFMLALNNCLCTFVLCPQEETNGAIAIADSHAIVHIFPLLWLVPMCSPLPCFAVFLCSKSMQNMAVKITRAVYNTAY